MVAFLAFVPWLWSGVLAVPGWVFAGGGGAARGAFVWSWFTRPLAKNKTLAEVLLDILERFLPVFVLLLNPVVVLLLYGWARDRGANDAVEHNQYVRKILLIVLAEAVAITAWLTMHTWSGVLLDVLSKHGAVFFLEWVLEESEAPLGRIG